MTIFVQVKIYTIIALIGIFVLTTACPGTKYVSEIKKLQDNNMDFPDLRKEYYNGISFLLSGMFNTAYNNQHVITDNAKTMVIYNLDLNFTVETFDEYAAEVIQYAFDDEIDAINAVHDNYILKRQASLFDFSTSVKKEVPKSVGFPGFIQVVHGNTYSYDDEASYFTATLAIDGTYFVFQLIGKKENMGYLYDDFIDLLSSVEK